MPTYLKCPDCQQKSLLLTSRRSALGENEDSYFCTNGACSFECVACGLPVDQQQMQRITAANPETDNQEECPSDLATETPSGPTAPIGPTIASPGDLDYALACNAYRWNSFTPESNAKRHQEDYAADVNGLYRDLLALCTNDDQRSILATEIQRYKQNYLKLEGAYLQSLSRCASSFVTGPSNFPTARMEKRNDIAHRRLTEFLEWRTRARAAIAQKLKDARTVEEVVDAEWRVLEADILDNLASILAIDKDNSPYTRSLFVNSIVGKVERLAQRGNVTLVERAAACIVAYNETHKKPAISKASKFWGFVEVARQNAAKNAQPAAETQTLHQDEQVTILLNAQLDRVQIVFSAIPGTDVRAKLKSAGWNWSPREGAWQRKATNAAKYSARHVLGLLTIN